MAAQLQIAHFPTSHQEVSLYAYISATRHPQLLKVLSGIAGMAAEPFLNHHLVYKPKRPRPTTNAPSTADLFYMQLVSRVETLESEPYNVRQQRWSMRLDDLPEVTRRPVVSRGVYSANTGMGDVIEFMESLGYTLQAAYFTYNLRFVHNNVIITLSQTLVPADPKAQMQTQATEAAQKAEAEPLSEDTKGSAGQTFGCPFPKENLKHVDSNMGWVMQAAVKVMYSTDVENTNVAVAELGALREVLKGVCDLEVMERLALNTRVR